MVKLNLQFKATPPNLSAFGGGGQAHKLKLKGAR